MRSLSNIVSKHTAVMLILCLVVPACAPGAAMAQEPKIASKAPAAPEDALPESPQPAGQSQQPAALPSAGTEPQDQSHKPVGTAAAPYERTTGIAASRPAGAAIAPAKQRRVRTILISLGVIAGAGIAVGSVAALSHGSPSRP